MSDHQKRRDFHPTKALKQQLQDLQTNGRPLHYEQDVPLTQKDRAMIRSLFFKITLFCIALSIPFAGVLYFFRSEETVMVICGVALVCFVYVIGRAGYQLGSNLKTGKKVVVRGIITDRFTRKEYGPADEDGKRPEKMVSYFQVGSREFRVDRGIYADHKVGEAIELHYIASLQGKPYFLFHKRLEGAGLAKH
jgi:hypothetical protein